MYYVVLLAICGLLLFVFCLFMYLVGSGRREYQGGPVIRSRKRRGIIRYPEDPYNTRENYHL